MTRTAKFAWLTLIYNVIVVVWGVFLRASKSGDGCGKYWLTCHGEVIPSAPELKTIIEFSHRVMSGLDFFVVLLLLVFVLVYCKGRRQVRVFAVLSFVFIVTEALIGAGLVLTGNVANTYTAARPLWSIGHLINTFLLLGSLSMTAYLLTAGGSLSLSKDRKLKIVAIAGTSAIILIGITGAIASLTNMLFPSANVIEALKRDFAPNSDFLLRIRILHPIGAVLLSVLLGFFAGWLKSRNPEDKTIGRLSGLLSVLLLLQVIVGGVTLLTGAPIVMALVHLLLADGVWISWILLLGVSFRDPETTG